MNESRDDFCRTGRGRSYHVEGPKTEKAQEPTVGSLVRRIWRVSEAEYGRVCKVEGSHGDKKEQCA